jgi:hypothetical protein
LQFIIQTVQTQNLRTKHDLQSAFHLIRLCIPQQLNHLWRTCSPTDTLSLAADADKLVRHTLFQLLHIVDQVQELQLHQKRDLCDRIHLRIKLGGLGIPGSVDNSRSGFIGSLSLCLHYITTHFPILHEHLNSESLIPLLNSFRHHSTSLHQLLPSFTPLDLPFIATNCVPKLQHTINDLFHQSADTRIDHHVDDSSNIIKTGFVFLQPNSQHRVIQIQHLANKDPINRALWTALPNKFLTQFSNSGFRMATQLRLLLDIRGTRRFCSCGKLCDLFLHHGHSCPNNKYRNPIRNSLHSNFTSQLRSLLRSLFSSTTCPLSIPPGDTEPELSDYAVADPSTSRPNISSKARADIVIHDSTTDMAYLIDVTTIDPLSDYASPYKKPGHPAEIAFQRKQLEYHGWQFPVESCQLIILPLELIGTYSDTCLQPLFDLLCTKYHLTTKRTLVQSLSIIMHALRTQSITNIHRYYSLDLPPTVHNFSSNHSNSNYSTHPLS